jgi:hypothetical protein
MLLLLAADELPTSYYCDAFSFVITSDVRERPLLHEFGRGIIKRIRHSEEGANRFGQVGAYTSDEIIPCLDMQSIMPRKKIGGHVEAKIVGLSSRRAIRRAFAESSCVDTSDCNATHGRSSGSGCTIVRLTGSDATSIRGLMQYANRFFDKVDDDDCNSDMKNAGVFRIDDHIYAGFDDNVNGEGKMQFLDTRIMPNKRNIDPLLLPLEVGELVGTESLTDAHRGMEILLKIGTQITSAVLDMDSLAAEKLIDDGTHIQQNLSRKSHEQRDVLHTMMKDDVSNSYHRLIRYLKPDQSSDSAAFQAHVDSSFLTLIPMPELPGLEVWCPSNTSNGKNILEKNDCQTSGEWVRPTIPLSDKEGGNSPYTCAYVIALAGEFLQLTSNGRVPVCIHRVIPPKTSLESDDVRGNSEGPSYKPRVSAPMFLRPRRGEGALLDVSKDLKLVNKSRNARSSTTMGNVKCKEALYFEKGLIDECDGLGLWSAHEIMKHK